MMYVICTDISGLEDGDYDVLLKNASCSRRHRAERYRHRDDALRCLTAEALLRHAVGMPHFTEEKGPDGKPYIRELPGFHYNLSHSGRWVVLAFGDGEVGVDVERIREDTDFQHIASRFFSVEEQRYIRDDPEQSRSRFFEVWTAKESYIKYLGTGLKTSLPSFSVFSLAPELRMFHHTLADGYLLSLCTTEDDYMLQTLDARQLVQEKIE